MLHLAFGEERRIRTSLSLLAAMLLVPANGFFVAAEFALVSVSRTRILLLALDVYRRARQVLKELRNLATNIGATQLGITIANLALSWISEPAVAGLVQPLLDSVHFIPDASRAAVTHPVSLSATIIAAT